MWILVKVYRNNSQWKKGGKYVNKRAIDTENYLGELEKTDDPKWEEKKVNYTNTWAQKAKQESGNAKREYNRGTKREYSDDDNRRERRNSGSSSGSYRSYSGGMNDRWRN